MGRGARGDPLLRWYHMSHRTGDTNAVTYRTPVTREFAPPSPCTHVIQHPAKTPNSSSTAWTQILWEFWSRWKTEADVGVAWLLPPLQIAQFCQVLNIALRFKSGRKHTNWLKQEVKLVTNNDERIDNQSC